MTTQTTQELSAEVALALGWKRPTLAEFPYWCEQTGYHYAPSNPRELIELMVKYDVWPMAALDGVYTVIGDSLVGDPYTDEASKLEAATRVILRGVLARIGGEKK